MKKYSIEFSKVRNFPKFWLIEDRYTIIEQYRYWDDPTYGNGGGEFCGASRSVFKTNSREKAEKEMQKFIEFNGNEV